MRVAILGYGKEGKANEEYCGRANEVEIISPYRDGDYEKINWTRYDLVLRSPSVRPREGFSSATQYFLDHCPAPIIGVTGTKGKGTTCSMITEILRALGEKVFLVGNIGVPAITKLDEIKAEDVVVYEMSSFQLWNVTKSPRVAVVLRIAPDHLNVHKDFAEYVEAKSHIAEFQGAEGSVIYFRENRESREIAEKSAGRKIPYPVSDELKGAEKAKLKRLLDTLTVPGQHNRENAEAALLAVAAYYEVGLAELIDRNFEELKKGLANFKGLPHHIEFVRELNGVGYYDDSFSTAEPALEVAVAAFPDKPLILIAGGQDKGVDLTEMKKIIFGAKNLARVFLIGEIAEKLAENEDKRKYTIVKTLVEAVNEAQKVAESVGKEAVVLLSPGAASLDMFESYYARGDEFQGLVRGLK